MKLCEQIICWQFLHGVLAVYFRESEWISVEIRLLFFSDWCHSYLSCFFPLILTWEGVQQNGLLLDSSVSLYNVVCVSLGQKWGLQFLLWTNSNHSHSGVIPKDTTVWACWGWTTDLGWAWSKVVSRYNFTIDIMGTKLNLLVSHFTDNVAASEKSHT